MNCETSSEAEYGLVEENTESWECRVVLVTVVFNHAARY